MLHGHVQSHSSEDLYADLAKDVKKRFNKSKYEVERPIPIGKAKNHKSNNGCIVWENNERVFSTET